LPRAATILVLRRVAVSRCEATTDEDIFAACNWSGVANYSGLWVILF